MWEKRRSGEEEEEKKEEQKKRKEGGGERMRKERRMWEQKGTVCKVRDNQARERAQRASVSLLVHARC